MKETNVLRSIWLRLGMRCKLWRMNSGQAWVGYGKPRHLQDGSVVLEGGRPINLGFGDPANKPVSGPGDLQGYTSIVITPEMVGRTVAVYTSIETKESGGGVKREKQVEWIEAVKKAGGIAGFAKSPDEAEAIVLNYLHSPKVA